MGGGGHWQNIFPFQADSQRGTQTPFRVCCFGNHMAIVGGRQENRQPPCLHACFHFFYYPGQGSEVAHLPGSKQMSDVVEDTLGWAQLLATPSRYQVNLGKNHTGWQQRPHCILCPNVCDADKVQVPEGRIHQTKKKEAVVVSEP